MSNTSRFLRHGDIAFQPRKKVRKDEIRVVAGIKPPSARTPRHLERSPDNRAGNPWPKNSKGDFHATDIDSLPLKRYTHIHAYFRKISKRFTTKEKTNFYDGWLFNLHFKLCDLCDLAYKKACAIFTRASEEALRTKSWEIIFLKKKETSDSIVRLSSAAATSFVYAWTYLSVERSRRVCISGKREELRHRLGSCHFSTEESRAGKE